MKKRTVAIFLGLTLALGLSMGAFAAGVTTKMIEAQYMGISLVVDGSTTSPKDANGNAVEPFLYNGTTYLPVRAVGEALGKTVEWDQETKTVYIGPRPGVAVGLAELPPYQKSAWVMEAKREHFKVAGKEQSVGLKYTVGYGDDNNYALWNLEGKYQNLTLTMGHVDGTSAKNCVVTFYLNGSNDGVSYDLSWEELPKTVTIPLNGAQSLKIAVSAVDDGTLNAPSYGFYDFKFA